MRYLSYGLVAIVVSVASAAAEEWSCRNNNAEITCAKDACEVILPDAFTPAELTVNTDGAISLCAYSGCWAGPATSMLKTGRYLSAIGLELPWSAKAGTNTDIAVSIDTATRIATVLTGSYAHPMTCTMK